MQKKIQITLLGLFIIFASNVNLFSSTKMIEHHLTDNLTASFSQSQLDSHHNSHKNINTSTCEDGLTPICFIFATMVAPLNNKIIDLNEISIRYFLLDSNFLSNILKKEIKPPMFSL